MSEISKIGRTAQGVRIMKVGAGKVMSVAITPHEDEEATENDATDNTTEMGEATVNTVEEGEETTAENVLEEKTVEDTDSTDTE